MLVKELTASTFVVARAVVPLATRADVWRVGLVVHPRMGDLLPPGGHVEAGETPPETAVREVREEAGLAVRLWPGPAMPLPEGYPHPVTPAPWWTVTMPAAPDNHTGEPHVHVDFIYVAVADSADPVQAPECDVRWLGAAQIDDEPGVSEDARLQAKHVLACAADSTGPVTGGASTMSAGLAHLLR